MSRVSRVGSEKLPAIEPGDVDIVSKARHFARIEQCNALHMETMSQCTRALGHDENRAGSAASVHVHTDKQFLVLEVWH